MGKLNWKDEIDIFNPLPADAQYLLKAAAAIEPDVPFGMSEKRHAALEEAIKTVKQQYPHLFKKEKQNERKPIQKLWPD